MSILVGIAPGPPRGPWVVDLWVNGSPNPLCYHKSPLPFSEPDGFARASLRMDARAKLHPSKKRDYGEILISTISRAIL